MRQETDLFEIIEGLSSKNEGQIILFKLSQTIRANINALPPFESKN